MELGKKMEYVVSPGVCNRDYGGPLYHEFTKNSFKTFIVTGLVNVRETFSSKIATTFRISQY